MGFIKSIKKSNTILDFDNVEQIRNFIMEKESNVYSGKNNDNQDVTIIVDKGKGMIASILNSKNWWEWNEYDEKGYLISQGVSLIPFP